MGYSSRPSVTTLAPFDGDSVTAFTHHVETEILGQAPPAGAATAASAVTDGDGGGTETNGKTPGAEKGNGKGVQVEFSLTPC